MLVAARGPVWSSDGKRLYYHANLIQRFIAVDIGLSYVRHRNKVALPIKANCFGTPARNYDRPKASSLWL